MAQQKRSDDTVFAQDRSAKSIEFENQFEQTGMTEDAWHQYNPLEKSITMSRFANLIASYYLKEISPNIQYRELGPLDARISFDLNPSTYGSFSPSQDRILINGNKVDNYAQTLLVLSHEATHYGQDLLIETNPNTLSKEAQDHRAALIASKQVHTSETFGIPTKGRVYLSPSSFENTSYKSLAHALYNMNPLEREANDTILKLDKELHVTDIAQRNGQTVLNISERNQKSINEMRQRYVCPALSDEQILQIYDNAIINVAIGRLPSNPIEASMTYDLAALLFAQKIDNQELKETLMEKLLDETVKSAAMSKVGFENTMTISLSDAQKLSLSEIHGLSKSVLEQNPHVIAIGIYKFGIDALAKSEEIQQQLLNGIIGDSAFDRWYFSKSNFLTSYNYRIAEELGSDYTRESRHSVLIGDTLMINKESAPNIDLNELFNESNASLDLDTLNRHITEIQSSSGTDYFEWNDRAK